LAAALPIMRLWALRPLPTDSDENHVDPLIKNGSASTGLIDLNSGLPDTSGLLSRNLQTGRPTQLDTDILL
jgi:hypothetical protein